MIPEIVLKSVPAKLAAEVKDIQDGIMKFVKVNNEYRFVDGNYAHCTLAAEGEVAESAGTFFIFPDYLRIEDSYSSTLRIGARDEDWEHVRQVFGRPLKGKWE